MAVRCLHRTSPAPTSCHRMSSRTRSATTLRIDSTRRPQKRKITAQACNALPPTSPRRHDAETLQSSLQADMPKTRHRRGPSPNTAANTQQRARLGGAGSTCLAKIAARRSEARPRAKQSEKQLTPHKPAKTVLSPSVRNLQQTCATRLHQTLQCRQEAKCDNVALRPDHRRPDPQHAPIR